jgi:hypothetical protein
MAVRVSRPKASSSVGPTQERHAYVHPLNLRLTGERCRLLRCFVPGHEDHTGRRVTQVVAVSTEKVVHGDW